MVVFHHLGTQFLSYFLLIEGLQERLLFSCDVQSFSKQMHNIYTFIAKSLLNLPNNFRLHVTKFLTKFDTIMLFNSLDHHGTKQKLNERGEYVHKHTLLGSDWAKW